MSAPSLSPAIDTAQKAVGWLISEKEGEKSFFCDSLSSRSLLAHDLGNRIFYSYYLSRSCSAHGGAAPAAEPKLFKQNDMIKNSKEMNLL